MLNLMIVLEYVSSNYDKIQSLCCKLRIVIHTKKCHEGLSATNPNDMACMFYRYFELAELQNY